MSQSMLDQLDEGVAIELTDCKGIVVFTHYNLIPNHKDTCLGNS